MTDLMKGEAAVDIAADPEKVWALVSDVTRTGEWSPENRGGHWLEGATGPETGARFRASNKKGWMRWSNTCRVEKSERGRVFQFVTVLRDKEYTRWRYTFEPTDGGTRVTESFESLRYPIYLKLLQPPKKRQPELEANLRASLEDLKRAVESGT